MPAQELLRRGRCHVIGWPPKAVPLAVIGALLPDADLFIEPFLRPGSAFDHRGFTHSLFGIAVLAPVIALVAAWFNKEKGYIRTKQANQDLKTSD